MSGPDVLLPPRIVTPIGLLVHELTTNAVKHGSLSVVTGEVSVVWSVVEGSPRRLRLSWHERGGPPVEAPSRIGYGSRLIDRTIKGELQGDADLQYLSDGLRANIDLPLAQRQVALVTDAATQNGELRERKVG